MAGHLELHRADRGQYRRLLTAPIGSGDHTNYAAYGRIAMGGADPYVESPIKWRDGLDPVAGAVQAPWQDTPSVYGPVATAFQSLCSALGGDNLRDTVWVAVRWYRPGGSLTVEAIADQYLTVVLDGLLPR